jgi:putative FmdB family regulatory protein
MPFYEYQCRACGALTEVLQKISDAALKKCPECGKNQLTKLISAPVFRLKGSGWYETDFKSDSDNKRNLAGPDTDAPAASSDEAKPAADAKPAETAAAKPAEAAKPTKPAKPKPKPKPQAKAQPKAKAKTKPKAHK